MKHLNLKFINLLNFKNTNFLIIVILFFSFKGISQTTSATTDNIMETIVATGNEATGSSGTVTYSIGQVFYTYIGETVYNVAQGIQHQEIKETLGTEENIEPNAEVIIFPNPAADFVTINLKGFDIEAEAQSYQFYDMQGRLLKQDTITQTETQINLNGLTPSVYLLRVNIDNKFSKTFKILKK